MFGKRHKKTVIPSIPAGISRLVLCVVDGKRRIRYRLEGEASDPGSGGPFHFLDESNRTVDHPLLLDAFDSRSSISLALSHVDGLKKYIYVLPYEHRRSRWHYACLEVAAIPADPDTAEDPACALADDRACLLLIDPDQIIRTVSSHVPETFGYAAENLPGLKLRDLFPVADYEKLLAQAADSGEAVKGCTFFCLDGSRRDVELRKFSLTDRFTLYGICDVSPRQRNEDLAEAAARERQRIGQDLHDSIGQTLTGISLLSRSLSNMLRHDDHYGSRDASQISELADEASNQIRQISRGLMPSDVVRNGLCASLQELARMTTNACGLACEVRFDASLKFADVAVETHLYRIVQEAVNNSVRHAEATRIDIVVSEVDGMIQLQVIDNGRWIEPEANVIGIGLKTMEYRASAIGGRLQISTSLRGGTEVTCRLEPDESLATKI